MNDFDHVNNYQLNFNKILQSYNINIYDKNLIESYNYFN